MSEKLKDYQVVDVLCGGAFYKVKHKVTNNIFAWKACDCSAYSDRQVQNIVSEVKTIRDAASGNLLRYCDTILHDATKTLYFVLEYGSWQSLRELIDICEVTDKYFSETFIWYLLLELAKTCKQVENFNFAVLRKCLTSRNIYIDGNGGVCVDCFQLQPSHERREDLMKQVGEVIFSLCHGVQTNTDKIEEFQYSDDLKDIIAFVTDARIDALRPEVIIFHPTILANIEGKPRPKAMSEILVSSKYSVNKSELNKCDSEKVVEMCKSVKPLPRSQLNAQDCPVYVNISPKRPMNKEIGNIYKEKGTLSPTLAALALELPGYVPRCRRPYGEVMNTYSAAQKVSEETFSHQWMSRLIALRAREQSLNKRERDLVVKEIINSPDKVIVSNNDPEALKSNGITLPPVIASAEKNHWRSRRRRRRSGSVRTRARKSYSYEDLDSSLSADTGDGSIIVTTTKFTADNMPRRNIFPDTADKKVHFTPSNPFTGSDESITFTFYELDNVDGEHNHNAQRAVKDINQFKYLETDNATEKRVVGCWSHSSPAKQAKVFNDITNRGSLRKTPSKNSLTSQSSVTSCSMMSARSHWSMESSNSKVSEGYVSDRTRSSMRQCPQTPSAPSNLKKTKNRKSLLHFKTPFKFKTSTKV
ncbi:serine/threonine-protein kinase Nek2-like [Battus philenor]|uniref:serine/threonine-protein kinase Nek2-like n=1 Tax=Battus philenor TaxID=42288 RepID=UPI0035D01AF3